MNFSITTDLVDQHSDLAAELPAFAAAGFSAVHWCQDWTGQVRLYDDSTARDIRRRVESAGLRIADVHGYAVGRFHLRGHDDLFMRVNANRVRFARDVGADVVVVHLPVRRYKSPAQAVERSLNLLGLMEPICRPLGVRMAVENLAHPTQPPDMLDALFARFDADFLGFCYDSGHAVCTDTPELVRKYADRLIATHLHDNDGTADQHRLPGQGNADWPMILTALRAANYARPLNVELNKPKDANLETYTRQAFETISKLAGQYFL